MSGTVYELERRRSGLSQVMMWAIVFLLTLTITEYYVLKSKVTPPTSDELLYDMVAKEISREAATGEDQAPLAERISKNWVLKGLVVRGATYPYFLSYLYRVFGEGSYGAVYALQAILYSITVVVTGLIGQLLFSLRVGLIAAFLYAFYLPSAWHTCTLLTETLLEFLMIFFLLSLALFLRRKRWYWAFLSGLFVGMLYLSHSTWAGIALPMIILTVLACLILIPESRRTIWALPIGALLVVLPWYRLQHQAGVVSGQGGLGFGGGGAWTFYAGSHVERNGQLLAGDKKVSETYLSPDLFLSFYQDATAGRIQLDPIVLEIMKKKIASGNRSEWIMRDSDYLKAGVLNIVSHPRRVPVQLAIKGYRYFVAEAAVIYESALHILLGRAVPLGLFQVTLVILLLLSLSGLTMILKKQPSVGILFIGFCLHTGLILLTYPSHRYLYPNLALYFLSISFLVDLVIGRIGMGFRNSSQEGPS